MADVLLISPPSRTKTMRMPLGLMHLSSCLSRDGISNEICDPKDDTAAMRNTAKHIARANAPIVGITCCATEIVEVAEICRIVRNLNPLTRIILGGPHPTMRPEHFEGVNYDHIIRGEGEELLPWAVAKILSGEDVPRIMGPTPPIADMDTLPFPAYEKIDVEYYARPNVWTVRSIYLAALGVLTSRGCPYRCKFCVAHTVFGRKSRRMSPARAVSLVEFLVQTYHIDGVYWWDEVFTIDKPWVIETCSRLVDSGLGIVWGCETRPNLAPKGLVKIMRRAGCVQIDAGYESGSQSLLNAMAKGMKVYEYYEFADGCKKARMRSLANMMVNIPGETITDINKSVDFLNDVEPNVVLWAAYRPIPGVAFGRELEVADLADPDKVEQIVQEKYKFSHYPYSLRDILFRLRAQFPTPRQPMLRLSLRYYWRCVRYVSWLFSIWYWRVVFNSRRKWQYLCLWRVKGLSGR